MNKTRKKFSLIRWPLLCLERFHKTSNIRSSMLLIDWWTIEWFQ